MVKARLGYSKTIIIVAISLFVVVTSPNRLSKWFYRVVLLGLFAFY